MSNAKKDLYSKSEIRDGMRIDWQTPIIMDDGITLRADVYRPIDDGRYPVILSYGVYGKGISFQEGYPMQWDKMVNDHPEILEGSTNKYQNWEVSDPERWVPHGYVVIRVDSRGAGWSEGILDPMCPKEREDIYECIEWAAVQPWSSGNVGMLGISYYAVTQWCAASLNPPHLKAIIPWEGFNDHYRDAHYHGGIMSEFQKIWKEKQVTRVQYGLGKRTLRNPNTGEFIAGPVELSEDELAKNFIDPMEETKKHSLCDEWQIQRSADLSKVNIPFLSCANWGGQGIHPRGNFNGFTDASSSQKWLEAHGDTHWSLFYSGYGLAIQKRFFDHFLKGIKNGWDKESRVQLNIRHPGEKFVLRMENEWPLARTQWSKLYLDTKKMALSNKPISEYAKIEYETTGTGVTFSTQPLEQETEITGPIAAKLYISSSTTDTDLFLVVRVFDPEGKDLTFQGALDPNTPIAQGWLRASHRKLDKERSKFYQPYHPHDKAEILTPGTIYECDVEILPTCIVIPAGWRIALTILGKDYEYEGEISQFGKEFYYSTKGTGGMTHADPGDRPASIYNGKVMIHSGGDMESYLILPIIPEK